MPGWMHVLCMGLLAGLTAAGCSPSEPDAPDGATSTADVRSAPAETGSGRPRPSVKADVAVREVVAGMQARRPEAIWNFLPPSYGQDVNKLVREFAGRMDPELWNRTFATLRRATNVLHAKKEFILEHPRVQSAEQIDVEELEAAWDGLVGLVETLATSEISDLENLKRFDGGTFFAQTGGRLMQQIAAVSALTPDDDFAAGLEELGEVKATLVSESADGRSAVVRLESPDPEDEPRDVEFVLVEGKWIPRDLADAWDATIADYRTDMLERTAPESVQQTRDQVLPLLVAIDGTLKDLERAKTQDEFNLVVQQQIEQPLQAMFGKKPAPKKPRTSAAPRGRTVSVSVVVRGEVTDETLIEERLREAGAGDITTFADGDAVRFEVTGVQDVAAFAESLRFGKVAAVDAQRRSVTIDLPRQTNGGP